jgi:hypothetical protein
MGYHFVAGTKYKVRHRSEQQRRTRESVMTYLGGTSWNARPAAGTQELPASWIISAERVPAITVHYVNRLIPKGEER